MIFANTKTEVWLRSKAAKLGAAERECYYLGVAKSTNLDGLAATNQIAKDSYQEDDAMEIDNEVRSFFMAFAKKVVIRRGRRRILVKKGKGIPE